MITSEPLISVIIATYNRVDTIARAIDSVLTQSYKNLELIVIDDGSTDQTKDVVGSYLKDHRISYFYQENGGNNVYPMNKGVELSRGEYIAILDDDDIWSDKDKIKKQAEFLEKNKEYVLVGGGAVKSDRSGREIVRYLMPEKDYDIRQKILTSSMFVHVSVLFRKESWRKVGGYDKNFGGAADWDLWMKLGNVGKFYNIQDYLVTYTAHKSDSLGYVERNHKKLDWLRINIELKKKHAKNYPHFKKAIIFCWFGYLYSLLPGKRELWPMMFKLRSFIFRDFKTKNGGYGK